MKGDKDMNTKIINVINANGAEVQAEVLATFLVEDLSKKYIIYTLNEENENGMVKIYVAELREENGTYNLISIDSDDEWNMIKEIMKKMARGE